MNNISDFIRLRFCEAADTDRHLPDIKRPSQKSGNWPQYFHDFKDRNGWGAKALTEERERFWNRRYRPDSAAVSRWEEVIEWSCRFIEDEQDRILAWGWAFCAVTSRSFSKLCKEIGLSRSSAYNRINFIFDKLGVSICNNGKILHSPDQNRLGQVGVKMASLSYTLDERAQSPRHWISPDAMAVNDPTQRDFSWAEDQAERRRRAEAKKRKLLGVE